MAIRFGGVGDALVENPKNQETDNVSKDESQYEDLIRQLLTETANIKQFVEDKYNEPKEAIHEIEQRLNNLTLALCHQNTPIENVLDILKPYVLHKRKHPWRVPYYKIYPY